MNLLFSIDDAYVDQWKVTLFSIVHNSNFQELSVYILQKEAFFMALYALFMDGVH